MSGEKRQFIFETPNTPEEFGVLLPPPDLRRLDFSALDFQSLLRSNIEYIRTYYPDAFNDFVASNGYIMLLELLCYTGNVLSQRSDVLADESFLPTSQTKQAVIDHLALINQRIMAASPATVDIEISLQNPVGTEVKIPSGIRFSLPGPDGKPVYYEVFRAPGDFTSPISIPASKRGIIAFGLEGFTESPTVVYSAGGPGQLIDLTSNNVLDEPITVSIKSGNESSTWLRVQVIEKSKPNDEVYEVVRTGSGVRIKFGNDVNGKSPLAGDEITVTYRVGGGTRGRIAAGIINETRPVTPLPPLSATIEAVFRNPVPSQGGTDEESLNTAKVRAPKQFATHNSAVTGEDYGTLAKTYSHPVYGTVAKALGTIRTGIDTRIRDLAIEVRAAPTVEEAIEIMHDKFINQNIVEVYVLAEGPDSVPVKPNLGLKRGLMNFLSEINVLTDEVRVLDGNIKFVDIQATIIINRSADPGTVKVQMQEAINNFFKIDNFDFGSPLYLSNLYQTMQDVPGVKYVNIYNPDNDIISSDTITTDPDRINFNELIALGNVDLKFYFEQGNYRIPPVGVKGSKL